MDVLMMQCLSLIEWFSLEQTAESYFYVPDLGQVPEIDVPSYLPDLPGIADDLSYSADLGPGFAPSGPTHYIPDRSLDFWLPLLNSNFSEHIHSARPCRPLVNQTVRSSFS